MLRKKSVTRFAAATAAGLCISLGATAVPAQADPPPTVTEVVYSALDVTTNIVANALAATQFVLEQVLAGRLVDLLDVRTSVLPNLTLVWEDGTQIGETFVQTATSSTNPADVATALGFETTDDEDDPSVVGEAVGTGLKASSFNGAAYTSGQCYSASISRGKMTYCGIKYRITESSNVHNLYFYDRWVTATGTAVNNSPDNSPTKIDIRTRPKSSGSNINALLDYEPHTSISHCNTVVSLGVAGYGFSASIPISECDEVAPYVDASSKTMRVVFDQGAVFSGRTHSVEMGVVYRTPAGVTANAAHYNYTKFCTWTYDTCNSVSKTVGGW